MSNSAQKEQKNPTHNSKYHWDREEHIIAMDAYLRYRPQSPTGKRH